MEKIKIRIVKEKSKSIFLPVLIGLVSAGIFSSVFFVFALPYSPGTETNPDCYPTDPTCTVTPSAEYSFGSNNFSGTGNFVTTGTGEFSSLTLTTSALTVGNGGTSRSSFTAYALIAGGTLEAGALQQISGVGTSGQLLTSNGAGALPTWQNAPASMVYPGAGIAVSNGSAWAASLTDNHANWDTAYTNASQALGASATPAFSALTLGATGVATGQLTLAGTASGTSTIATTATGGDIVLTPGTAGDATILSDSGNIVLGSNKTAGFGETLKFDFETTENTVALSSATGVTSINFGSLNLATAGALTMGGSTAGTLVTRVKAGVPDESDANGSVVLDSSDGRIYFRYGNAWHYAAQNAGFQIPDFETTDPVSGETIKEGDIVLGMINQTMSDSALHGVWVKWDSIRERLLSGEDISLSSESGGSAGTGEVSGVKIETMLDKVKNVLTSLGISAENGIVSITQLASQKVSTDVVAIKQMQMTDKATGEAYCTWIENGEWVKVKGECGSVENAVEATEQNQHQQEVIENAAQDAAQQAAEQAAQQTVDQVTQQVQEQIQDQVQQEVSDQLEKQGKEKEKAGGKSAESLNVSSVADMSDINVAHGSALDSAGLSSDASITLSDGTTVSVAVAWDGGTPAFDGNAAGTYVFWGELTLPSNVTNTDNLKAIVHVVVGETPVSEQPVSETEDTGTLIQEGASNLINGIWKFCQWILNSLFNKGFAADLSSFAAKDLKTDFSQITSQLNSAKETIMRPINVILGNKK